MTFAGLPADLLGASHRQTADVWLTLPGQSREVRVARPTAVTVSFDALRAPRVSATMTLPAPLTAAEAAYTDHRNGARLLIRAGYALGGQRWTDTLADLAIRDRVLDRTSGSMTVTAAGAESLVLDRPLGVAITYPAGMPIETVCRDVTTRTLGTADLTNLGVTGTLPEPVLYSPGADLFDLLETVTDAANAYLYADEVGRWWLRTEPALGAPTVTLRPGAGGTVIGHSQDLTRDLYATQVLTVHEWTDPATFDARRVVGSATAAAHSTAAQRTRVVRRTTPVGWSTANAEALALLARFRLAGGGASVTTVADYRVRPGATVLIEHPLGEPAPALVTSVRFDLLSGTMTLSTRDGADLPEG